MVSLVVIGVNVVFSLHLPNCISTDPSVFALSLRVQLEGGSLQGSCFQKFGSFCRVFTGLSID